jgi:hypothetical protein
MAQYRGEFLSFHEKSSVASELGELVPDVLVDRTRPPLKFPIVNSSQFLTPSQNPLD